MRERTKSTIKDLIEFAERLKEYRFDEHVRDRGLGFHLKKSSDESWTIEFDLPDNKERDATLYTLRLFDQQNERFSFHGLSKLAEDPGLSDNYRNKIVQIREAYYNYLEAQPEGIKEGFFENGCDPNRGEIMRVVMNGGLGHRRDQRKRERYKVWIRDPIREAVLLQVFTKIVYWVLCLIKELSVISNQETNKGKSSKR